MVDKAGSKLEAKSDYRSSRILGVALPAVYLSLLGAFCLAYGVLPGPELIALCFLVYAAYNKWTRRFVKDWFPFVSLFLSYEAMNSVVPSLAGTAHYIGPIELQLFGSIPTIVLQQFYRTPFLDYLCAFFYSLHFIAPAVFGFLLWKYRPENFGKYVLALAIGTYGALVTFLIYPVAPPWSAVTGVTRILFQVDKNIGIPFYRTLFDFVSANPNAAFPSLHAMYPWLISLFAFKIKKAKALPIIVFPIGVWFSAVYLGEHYVIDVIGGILYGTCAFFIAEKLIPLFMQRVHKGAKVSNPKALLDL